MNIVVSYSVSRIVWGETVLKLKLKPQCQQSYVVLMPVEDISPHYQWSPLLINTQSAAVLLLSGTVRTVGRLCD